MYPNQPCFCLEYGLGYLEHIHLPFQEVDSKLFLGNTEPAISANTLVDEYFQVPVNEQRSGS